MIGGVAVVERNGDALPVIVGLAICYEEFLSVGVVLEVHTQIKNPSCFQFMANDFVVGRGDGVNVRKGIRRQMKLINSVDSIGDVVIKVIQVARVKFRGIRRDRIGARRRRPWKDGASMDWLALSEAI